MSMSTPPQLPPNTPPTSTPEPGKTGGISNRTLTIGAIVACCAVLLSGIGLVATVATTVALTDRSEAEHKIKRPGGEREDGRKGQQDRMKKQKGMGGIPGGIPAIEHGDVVVQGPNATPITLRITRGQVTTVNATSIVVKAVDGYVGTYTVGTDTTVRRNGQPAAIDAIAVGDTATVIGEVSGETATAKRINAADAATAAQQQQRKQQRRNKSGSKQGELAPPSSN